MTPMADSTTRVTAGVDTHRDQHVVAALDERGGELGVRSFAATPEGYRHALSWLCSLGVANGSGSKGQAHLRGRPDPVGPQNSIRSDSESGSAPRAE